MRSSVLALFLSLSSLLGCAPPAPQAGSPAAALLSSGATTGFPITVVDDAGRQVSIARPPERIVSLAPSNTEILFALGLGDKLVAVDQFSDYPLEARQKPQLGSYVRPDLEQIVAMEPDLVFATGIHERAVVPEIEARRLTVVTIDGKNLDEVLERIELVGRLTGHRAQAEILVHQLRERANAISERIAGAPRRRVFFELSPQLHTAGPGSFMDDLVRRAGGQNIATDSGVQWPQLSQEVVVEKDPEVILLSHGGLTPEQVSARPGWQRITAVRNGRITRIDQDVTNRAGPRVVQGLEMIARALHPERFE